MKIAELIKYEGDNSTFVWKHPCEDFNSLTQLIVHENQEALFYMNGQALDLFGPGRYTLETQNIPKIGKVLNQTGRETPFHCEVYFINKSVQMAIKWGTPDRVRFIDPLTGAPLEIGASGEMNLQVKDARKLLIKLVGTMSGIAWGDQGGNFAKSLSTSFRPLISTTVKTNLASCIKENNINILEVDENLTRLSSALRRRMVPGFEEYGLTIPQFYVTTVDLPESDPNFRRIRELHTISLQTKYVEAEAAVKTAQAEAAVAVTVAERQAILEKETTATEKARREAEREVIRAQAEAQAAKLSGLAEAEVMRAKGYSEKDVLQAEVQKAYAAGIGEMGSSGGGGSSALGDIASLGVTLGALGGVVGMTKDAVAPLFGGAQQQPVAPAAPAASAVWNCACGQVGITGNFCSNCGAKRPAPAASAGWNCACGEMGITGNFCPNCGTKRPAPAVWNCACGETGISGNFCPNCGTKRT